MKRFRWNRASWYHAKHLSRLLLRLDSYFKPQIVDRYIELIDEISRQGDPLDLPLRWRLDRAKGGDEIPF